MQVSPYALSRGHRYSELCNMLAQQRNQARAIRAGVEALDTEFSALGSTLGKVRSFRYLGRVLTERDSDWAALHRNLAKARQRWARISPILRREGANAKVSGYFYKAVVQSVLLFGSETWVWTQQMRLTLQGFHHRVARRLTGRVARRQNGVWTLPPIEEALEAASLHPIEEYITRRRDHLLAHVRTRPIYAICQATPRLPGTPLRTRVWWEQFTVDNPFISDRV